MNSGEFWSQQGKVVDHIDRLIRVWIERSPFLAMATHDRAGRVDISPKGDLAGFVKVLDDRTLAIPDRPGNHRFDSFLNILATGRIAVMLMVPNWREVVRVDGCALVVRDAPLRARMAIRGRTPGLAILLRADEAFYHCGKAVLRSGLWSPDEAVSTDRLPTFAEAVFEQAGAGDRSLDELETAFGNNELYRLQDG